jgi:hypothetical protein
MYGIIVYKIKKGVPANTDTPFSIYDVLSGAYQ